MSIARRDFLSGALALTAAASAEAQWADPVPAAGHPQMPLWPARERFPLWPARPPGAPTKAIVPNWTMNGPVDDRQLWVRGVPFPEVAVYRPARPDGSSMLIVPGGGYGFVSVQNEGMNAARRFTPEGTTAFVLTYRLPDEGWANRHLAPLADAQRAMRLIRSRAASFKIDPARLGVLGFSAGGHLAADLAVSQMERAYAPVDGADALSARPAYLGLIYPVVTLIDAGPRTASMKMLLGPNPAKGLIEARSPVLHVTKDTTPSFVAHAMDDDIAPPRHSLQWIEAANRADAKFEAHLFAEGGHGFGLNLPSENTAAHWPELFTLFRRKHGG